MSATKIALLATTLIAAAPAYADGYHSIDPSRSGVENVHRELNLMMESDRRRGDEMMRNMEQQRRDMQEAKDRQRLERRLKRIERALEEAKERDDYTDRYGE